MIDGSSIHGDSSAGDTPVPPIFGEQERMRFRQSFCFRCIRFFFFADLFFSDCVLLGDAPPSYRTCRRPLSDFLMRCLVDAFCFLMCFVS